MNDNNNFNLLCIENKNIDVNDLKDNPEENVINTNSNYNDSVKNAIESQ